jgi:hypothetical protein
MQPPGQVRTQDPITPSIRLSVAASVVPSNTVVSLRVLSVSSSLHGVHTRSAATQSAEGGDSTEPPYPLVCRIVRFDCAESVDVAVDVHAINTLRQQPHPNVIRHFAVLTDDSNVVQLLMERCGGSLLSMLPASAQVCIRARARRVCVFVCVRVCVCVHRSCACCACCAHASRVEA